MVAATAVVSAVVVVCAIGTHPPANVDVNKSQDKFTNIVAILEKTQANKQQLK